MKLLSLALGITYAVALRMRKSDVGILSNTTESEKYFSVDMVNVNATSNSTGVFEDVCPQITGSWSQSCSTAALKGSINGDGSANCVIVAKCKGSLGLLRYDTGINLATCDCKNKNDKCGLKVNHVLFFPVISCEQQSTKLFSELPTAAPSSCAQIDGSFSQSCQGTFVTSDCVVNSRCRKMSQALQDTELSFGACKCASGEKCPMDNIDGTLKCAPRPGLPATTTTTTTTLPAPTAAPSACAKVGGSFSQSCSNTLVTPDCVVKSVCRKMDQSEMKTQLPFGECGCNPGQQCSMENTDGTLKCSLNPTDKPAEPQWKKCFSLVQGRDADPNMSLDDVQYMTIDECSALCTSRPDCGGFVVDASANNKCMIKARNPATISNPGRDYYSRSSAPECGMDTSAFTEDANLDNFSLAKKK